MWFHKPKPPPVAAAQMLWLSPIHDTTEAYLMAACALCSFAVSAVLFLVSLVLGSRLRAWQRLLPWQRMAFAADVVSLAHAAVVTPLGFAALSTTPYRAGTSCGAGGWGSDSLVTAPSPRVLVVACGISCGQFCFDCLLLCLYRDECAARFDPAGGSWVMWMHHAVHG